MCPRAISSTCGGSATATRGTMYLEAEQIQEIEAEVCRTIARTVSAMLPPPAPGWQTPDQVLVTSHDDLLLAPGPASRFPQSMLGIGSAVLALIAAWGVVLAVVLLVRRRAARRKANSIQDATHPRTAPRMPPADVSSVPHRHRRSPNCSTNSPSWSSRTRRPLPKP
jgi:hypothetical protein